MPLAEAKQRKATGVFEHKYTEQVKVYKIFDTKTGEIFSQEICGGPHVKKTAELGHFKIQKEEAVSAGIRRIKATVGKAWQLWEFLVIFCLTLNLFFDKLSIGLNRAIQRS